MKALEQQLKLKDNRDKPRTALLGNIRTIEPFSLPDDLCSVILHVCLKVLPASQPWTCGFDRPVAP